MAQLERKKADRREVEEVRQEVLRVREEIEQMDEYSEDEESEDSIGKEVARCS